MNWQEIKNANSEIKTTDIKGKEYAEVPQRIKAFRSVCPNGAIITTLLSNENGVCIFRASVYDEKQTLIGTGTAYEREDSTFINRTSYIENCETSAVGRALGMCGFGIDVSVASAEEVKNAMLNQEKMAEPKATENQIKLIEELYSEAEMESLFQWAKIDNLKDLTVSQASKIICKRKGNKVIK